MTGRKLRQRYSPSWCLPRPHCIQPASVASPSFLSNDETAFGLQAHAIATTAHDENGRLLPLYFQMMENVWFHPALVYWMAPVLAVVRPMPWAMRLPRS